MARRASCSDPDGSDSRETTNYIVLQYATIFAAYIFVYRVVVGSVGIKLVGREGVCCVVFPLAFAREIEINGSSRLLDWSTKRYIDIIMLINVRAL